MDYNKTILNKSFQIWDKLSTDEQGKLLNNSKIINYKKGEIIHKDENSCLGLIMISKGQVKAFSSQDGDKRITLYKLFENDICLFTASCIMKDVTFEIYLECEEDTEVLLIPTDKYEKILKESSLIYNYINQIILSRFSDVMWILEQVVFHSLDKRIANYILDEIQDSKELIITHERIAKDLGTAREVVSRLLKHFEKDNILKLSRNKIYIIKEDKLIEISEK